METSQPCGRPIREIDPSGIGRRIASTRKGLGLSGRALARRSGLRANRINELEKGANRLGLDEVVRVADALALDLEALVFGEEGRQVGRLELLPLPGQDELLLKVLERGVEAMRAERETP